MMIIAGFAGIGKTTFCENVENAVDFECMPFKYSNYSELKEDHQNKEEIKTSDEFIYHHLIDDISI